MKKFKILTFKQYKIFHSDSRNDKDMIKTKKISEKMEFFSITVYIQLGTKKIPHSLKFF